MRKAGLLGYGGLLATSHNAGNQHRILTILSTREPRGGTMRVYGYRVEQKGPRDLPALLARLQALPLEQRLFEARTGGMRLELSRPDGEFVYANFAKPRGGHGPGRMSRRNALTEFDMLEGDRFGEDTAFVYHVPSRYMVMQYNHAGPRMESVRDYLYAADLSFGGLRPAERGEPEGDRCGYRLGIVLKPDAHERLRQFGIYRSVVIDVSVPGALAADLEQGRSLGSVLNAPLPQGTQRMTIGVYSATDTEAGLGKGRVRQMLSDVQRLGHLVHKAVIKGRATPEDRIEKVDLVADRLSADLRIAIGNGLRLNTDDRWAALRQILQRWLDNREMPV